MVQTNLNFSNDLQLIQAMHCNREIFAQEIPVTKQVAYRHFLTEERLLKLGGPLFKEKILTLRKEGLKTEPAFAKALNLAGDPFEELLKLQTYSNNDLKFLFKD